MADDDGESCCIISCFVVGVLVFIVGVVLLCVLGTPAHPSIHVTDASLTPPNTTHHHYHLALNITIRNPSVFYKNYNKNIKLVAFCNNNLHKPIGTAEVLPFGQKTHEKDSFTALTFKGGEEEDDFQACGESIDIDGRHYDDIVIKIYISDIYYTAGPSAKDAWQSESEFKCNLKVPLITGADAVNGFEDTKCKSSFKLFY